ncbi:MAG: exodeoxyribonuclease VII large subunit [Acidimicrobiales bacterium]
MTVRTWTVDQVCSGVGAALEACFPDELWIRGEIQGLRRSPAGHMYFDLIEPGARGTGTDAKLGIVAFRGPLRGIEAVLKRVGDLRLVDGLEVRVRGRLDYYPPQGRVQFLMNAIDPRHTLGQLAADRDAVLRELAAEGLLEANKARPFPLVPLRIGLVTSQDSAAHHDFVHELEASGFRFSVLLAHTRVQGADAHVAIAQAVEYVAQMDVDVVAVVRGGGAKGDLIAFDHGDVARSIAGCPVPVLVGVGHEIDRSIADEVAHSSLKTPTACAGALVGHVRAFLDRIDNAGVRLRQALDERLGREQERLEADTRRLGRVAGSTVLRAGTDLDSQIRRLERSSARVLDAVAIATARTAGTVKVLAQGRLDRATVDVQRSAGQLAAASRRQLESASTNLNHAASLVRAVHPDRTLALGYAIVRDQQGRVIKSIDQAETGSAVTVELFDGHLTAQTVSTAPRNKHTAQPEDQ